MAAEVEDLARRGEHGTQRAPVGIRRERAAVRHHGDVRRDLDLRAIPGARARRRGKMELACRESAFGALGSARERARAGVRLEVARRAVVHAQHAVRKTLRRHEVVDGRAVLGEATVVETLPGTAARPVPGRSVLVHGEQQRGIGAVAGKTAAEVPSVDLAGAVLVQLQIVVNARGHNAVSGDDMIIVSPERLPEIDVVALLVEKDAEPSCVIARPRLARTEDRLPIPVVRGQIAGETQTKFGGCGRHRRVAGVDVGSAAALQIFEAAIDRGDGARHRASAGEARDGELVSGEIDRCAGLNGQDAVNRLFGCERVVRADRAVCRIRRQRRRHAECGRDKRNSSACGFIAEKDFRSLHVNILLRVVEGYYIYFFFFVNSHFRAIFNHT